MMPGVMPRTMSQRNTPRLACARELAIEVKMIEAMEVPDGQVQQFGTRENPVPRIPPPSSARSARHHRPLACRRACRQQRRCQSKPRSIPCQAAFELRS
jgi:hypothetical protein